MVAEDVLPKLCSLLASGSEDVRHASIALLWILSQHPHNQVGEVISQDQRESVALALAWGNALLRQNCKWNAFD